MTKHNKTLRILSFAAAAVPLIAKGFFPGGISSGGAFGSNSWLGAKLPGSRIDWTSEARQTWKNSAVGACLWYLCDTLPEAPMETRREGDDGKYKVVKQHPLTELLRRPNKHTTRTQLLQSTVLSLEIDGNAYWRIRRNIAGRIVELWYVPHWLMEPKWDSSNEFISHYDYQSGEGVEKIDMRDVVHFRMGQDPENTRKGLSRLKTVLREVVTDNEATTYTVAILKNLGMPGVVISTKNGSTIASTILEKLGALWKEKVTGDKRGEPLVIPGEIEINAPGYSPEQMCLDKIRSVPEARICAATRVPAMIAQLSVGNDQRTYSNMREAREFAYEGTVMPLQRLICEQIDLQLLPQMPNYSPADGSYFNQSEIRILQEDMESLYKRAALGFNAGFMKRSEAKQLVGLTFDLKTDDVYKSDVTAAQAQAAAAATGPPVFPQADPAVDAAAKSVRAVWVQKALDRRGKAEESI